MNKWWLTAGTALLLLLVACATDAKKKWKADEDFEFEEVRTNPPNSPSFILTRFTNIIIMVLLSTVVIRVS